MEIINQYGIYAMLFIVLVLLYGINIIKYSRKRKQASLLLNNIQVGDYIKTYSGLYGEVRKIENIHCDNYQEHTVVLKLDNSARVRIDIRAIYIKYSSFKTEKEIEKERADELKKLQEQKDKELKLQQEIESSEDITSDKTMEEKSESTPAKPVVEEIPENQENEEKTSND